ncbi:MAG: hypothetical protein FIA95_11560, partial [Gemmatimonadetes bacterium]|nr:hypothetical protein [Gemmatimonadota bacterium]
MQHRRILRLARSALALAALGALDLPGALVRPGASAQVTPDTTRLTISGVVYDRGSGAPIAGAVLRLAGAGLSATTGDDGRYTLVGLLRGTYRMSLDAVGYRSLSGDLRMVRSGDLDFPLDPLAGRAPERRPSRIVGLVLETETGNPVEGAEITVGGRAARQVSEAQGRFEIVGLPPGAHSLSVRYLGRAPAHAERQAPREATLDVEIRLTVKPVELAPMVVTATPRNSYLENMGFYQRRDAGLSGTRFTREALEERNPRSLGELLVSVPGLRVVPGQLGRFEVRMRRAIRMTVDGGEGCIPALFVDDIRSDPGWLQDLDPARVEALEIYSGANAPLRYNDACGVI